MDAGSNAKEAEVQALRRQVGLVTVAVLGAAALAGCSGTRSARTTCKQRRPWSPRPRRRHPPPTATPSGTVLPVPGRRVRDGASTRQSRTLAVAVTGPPNCCCTDLARPRRGPHDGPPARHRRPPVAGQTGRPGAGPGRAAPTRSSKSRCPAPPQPWCPSPVGPPAPTTYRRPAPGHRARPQRRRRAHRHQGHPDHHRRRQPRTGPRRRRQSRAPRPHPLRRVRRRRRRRLGRRRPARRRRRHQRPPTTATAGCSSPTPEPANSSRSPPTRC